MDIGLYKRARAIRHQAAMPFYPRSPAVEPTPAAPAQAVGNNVAKPAAAPWPLTPAPPPRVVTVEVAAVSGTMCSGGASGDGDVDRRAAMYISRVQERFRRERARMNDQR